MTRAEDAGAAWGALASDVTADSDLVTRTCAGDDAAFGVLVERYSRRIFRVAWQITRHESDAEDVVQETFLRAYRRIRQFDARSKFSTWVYRICVNYALDLVRARGRYVNAFTPEDNDDGVSAVDQIASDSPDPERLTASVEMQKRLTAALARLSEGERAAFFLRHYEALGIEEIARVLGIRQGAAKNSIFRAVQKLRRELRPLVGGAEGVAE
jgi:RNA polymerase sigma-70 factor (ECF subfamily)